MRAGPTVGRGAAVLVGDAVHGMSPNMGQGAALTFEDGPVRAPILWAFGRRISWSNDHPLLAKP